MTTFAERILAQLEDRPLSVLRLRKALGLKPRQFEELNRETALLHRAKRIVYVHNEWAVAPDKRADAPFDTVPATATQAELQAVLNGSRRHRATSGSKAKAEADRRRILEILADGPLPSKGIAKHFVGVKLKDIENRLTKLIANGRIVSGPSGYELSDRRNPTASADVASCEPGPLVDTTDLRFTGDRCDHGALLSEFCDACAEPSLVPGEFMTKERFEAKFGLITPMSDLRAELMESIDLVQAGQLSLEQVRAIIKLADCVADIDMHAEKAQ
jgi:hypothetical protein